MHNQKRMVKLSANAVHVYYDYTVLYLDGDDHRLVGAVLLA